MKILIPFFIVSALLVSCDTGTSTKPQPDSLVTADTDGLVSSEQEASEDHADTIRADHTVTDEQQEAVLTDHALPDTLPDEVVTDTLTGDSAATDDIADSYQSDEMAEETPDIDSATQTNASSGVLFISGCATVEGTSLKAVISVGGTAPFGTASGNAHMLQLSIFR